MKYVKFCSLLVMAFLFVLFFSGTSAAVSRNERTGKTYMTIQEAIDDSEAQDTIVVDAGTYEENIVINRENLTLKANETVIIDGWREREPVINIIANGSKINGFTLINGTHGIYSSAGWCNLTKNVIRHNDIAIWLIDSDNSVIQENEITDNTGGIVLISSNRNIISRNNISSEGSGISLESSAENTISSNIIRNCLNGIEAGFSPSNVIRENRIEDITENAICLLTSLNSVLRGNSIINASRAIKIGGGDNSVGHFIQNIDTSNTIDGKPVYYLTGISNRVYNGIQMGYLALVGCRNVTIKNVALSKCGNGIILANTNSSRIENCNISDDDYGIFLLQSSKNTIQSNRIHMARYDGIFIHYSSNNTILGNKISFSGNRGIHVTGSFNTIYGNLLLNNSVGLLISTYSKSNRIYGNSFIYNGIQAENEGDLTNLFNLTPPTGGNYWSDYTGNDENGDNFGDTPYTFSGGVDSLPLIKDPLQKLKVVSMDPPNGSMSISRTKSLVITFSSIIIAGTNYYSITVRKSTGALKSIIQSISGNRLIITPVGGWDPGVKFTVRIPLNAIENIAGNTLEMEFTSHFTSAIAVTAIDPRSGATGVSRTRAIVIIFSNSILAGPSYRSITVKTSAGRLKPISKRIIGNRLIITPVGSWSARTRYIITVPRTAVKTSSGNMMAADFKSAFTTR
ncbi:NosD domain-containing protein [Methanothermobacter sp. DP]|uniref:NosD domain-containing protein n=1 Tax=unclassified Methanothermobacter TaxID=2631116 RepID=UPI002AA59973|nr:NosD domain-containing protein [Methanothermobacter sp. DP]